jgi:phosphoribosylaminoimidazole carboxylase PurK protein
MQQGAAKRPTIGIVGGGQLGRMLTEAAKPLGYDVVVVDPSANCPAAQVGAAEITANLYDEAALKELTSRSDVITVEIEHLDTHVLEALENDGAVIHPAPATVRLIQDKYLQKVFLREHSVPVADFTEVASTADAEAALKNFGGKMLLKTRHGAYDGRGNMVVEELADIAEAFALFDGKALYAERFVPFERELAVMVGRSTSGDVQAYPVVQTIHQRNICVEVLSPAPVSKTVTQKAHTLAVTVANLLKGAGMYGIEMFLLDVRVRRGHVGLGLVVVVVRDEVRDGVVRKKSLELAAELGGECFVVGHHKRGAIELLDHVGDRESFSASCNPQKCLELLFILY